MGKLNQNIVIHKGDDLPIDFLHVGPFWNSQGQVVEIHASDDAEWRLHAEGDTDTVHVTKTKTAGAITFHESGFYESYDDLIRVQLEAADTSSMTAGTYEHQLLVKYGGTDEVVVASGTVTLRERA